MTHSDPNDFYQTREGAEIIKGQNLYKHEAFRCVICPNGERVFLQSSDMRRAYRDLESWGLMVAKIVLNQ